MRRACELAQSHRATACHRSRKRDRGENRVRLRDLAAVRVSYGYRRLHVLLPRGGWRINHKPVYRIYREEGLEGRTKKRRKRVSALRVALPAATRPNERRSMDFVSDSLHDGRRFRVSTTVDHFTRESPAIEVR